MSRKHGQIHSLASRQVDRVYSQMLRSLGEHYSSYQDWVDKMLYIAKQQLNINSVGIIKKAFRKICSRLDRLWSVSSMPVVLPYLHKCLG